MQTLTVYGSSDDLVSCEGIDGADEFCMSPDAGPYAGRIKIYRNRLPFLQIICLYDGVWVFAVMPFDEDYNEVFPEGEFNYATDIERQWGTPVNPYGELLRIKLPDGCLVIQEGTETEYEEEA